LVGCNDDNGLLLVKTLLHELPNRLRQGRIFFVEIDAMALHYDLSSLEHFDTDTLKTN
jgi:hypothetical protein